MCDFSPAVVDDYVRTAAAIMTMPLDAARRAAVATNMVRIASFAAHIAEVDLADDVEIAGATVT